MKYKDMVPRPTSEDFAVLKESLMESGQQIPIVINSKGDILDGFTRFDILSERGIPLKTTVKDFETEEEELKFVIQSNLARRHLSLFQKIELTYSLYKKLREKYHRGGHPSIRANNGGATVIIGKTIGCNRNSVTMGVWLIEHASETQKKKLRNGTIGIQTVYLYEHFKQKKPSKSYTYLGVNDEFECPHCNKSMTRRDIKKVNRNRNR